MPSVLYGKDGRVGRITLNRSEVLSAIDYDMPETLAACAAEANADDGVHVIVLSGAGWSLRSGRLDVGEREHDPGNAVGSNDGHSPKCP